MFVLRGGVLLATTAAETPVDLKRKLIAVLTLVIFLLSATPFPIQIK